MNTIEVLNSMCAEGARRHEDAPLVASEEEEETETSAAAEAAESGETKKSNKHKRPSSSSSGSKRPSKKAARLAEETERYQEEAAAAAQAKAEARQHEINLARAKRPDAEILVKDCTFNLISRESECESVKSAIIKAASS